MITKPLQATVQVTLVDEDDAGNIVGQVVLEPVIFLGLSIRDHLEAHLEAIERLCIERSQPKEVSE